MPVFAADLRYALRSLRRNPAYGALAVLTLALGIGASTALFSVIDAVLLRPLPYAGPGELVALWGRFLRLDIRQLPATPAEFADYRRDTRVFSGIAAFNQVERHLIGADRPERVMLGLASPNLFPLLGVEPARGRAFLPEEEHPDRANVVVLTSGFWRRAFGADPAIVGRRVTLGDVAYTVVGVLPDSFRLHAEAFGFSERADLWAPLVLDPGAVAQRAGAYSLRLVARLQPGVSIDRARAAMAATARDLEERYPRSYKGPGGKDGGWGITVTPLAEQVTGDVQRALLILFAAVAALLLVACANVVHLLLARVAARRREMAIRLALGAGRFRLMRGLAAEILVLALCGSAAGLLLAHATVAALVRLGAGQVPRLDEVAIDIRVFGFAALAALGSAAVCALAPALEAARAGLHDFARFRAGARPRRLLVAAEFALTLMLLVAAGLLLKSFARLTAVDPGFQPDRLLTARIALPAPRYAAAAQQRQFFERVLETSRALPGVESATLTSQLPLTGGPTDPFSIEGRPYDPNGPLSAALFYVVAPGYFPALGMPLEHGRAFTDADGDGAPAVAVINQALARSFWPQNPIGQRLKMGAPTAPRPWMTIVGVVGDARSRLDRAATPQIYAPYAQHPRPSMRLVLRGRAQAAALAETVAAIDPLLPLSQVRTMEQIADDAVAQPRFRTTLLALFAGVALLLAAAGIYGVTSYLVSRRTQEIGVRMALGARPADVLRLVIGEGLATALIGVVLGLAGSLAVTRLLATLLFGVTPNDPPTLAAVSMILIAVAVIACYVPARRAARVDPSLSLRAE